MKAFEAKFSNHKTVLITAETLSDAVSLVNTNLSDYDFQGISTLLAYDDDCVLSDTTTSLDTAKSNESIFVREKSDVPSFLNKEKVSTYYNVYIKGTKMKVGHITIDKNGLSEYVVTTGAFFLCSDENHFVKVLTNILSHPEFMWSYHNPKNT